MQGLFYVGMRYINRFAVYIRSAAVGCYYAGDDLYERRFTRLILAHQSEYSPCMDRQTHLEGVLELPQLSVYV